MGSHPEDWIPQPQETPGYFQLSYSHCHIQLIAKTHQLYIQYLPCLSSSLESSYPCPISLFLPSCLKSVASRNSLSRLGDISKI